MSSGIGDAVGAALAASFWMFQVAVFSAGMFFMWMLLIGFPWMWERIKPLLHSITA